MPDRPTAPLPTHRSEITLAAAPGHEHGTSDPAATSAAHPGAGPRSEPVAPVAAGDEVDFAEMVTAAVMQKLDERFGSDLSWVDRFGGVEAAVARMAAAIPTARIEGAQSGAAYTTTSVAERLGLSRRTVYRWRRTGRVFAVRQGTWLLYPAVQFDPSGVPLPHLSDVLPILAKRGLDGVELVDWLGAPCDALAGASPADQLRAGDSAAVLRLARKAGATDPFG